MSAPADLTELIDATLGLLTPYTAEAKTALTTAKPLEKILSQCQALVEDLEGQGSDPLRTIHHFACSGGTLMSRCLAAQPNTVVLSEVDPFSTIPTGPTKYAPTDLIMLIRDGSRAASQEIIEDVFLAGLATLFDHYLNRGQTLILRDHTHSHFCTKAGIADRPLIREVLAKRFTLKSVLTVRHPLDSYLSLKKKNWVRFAPATIEEYARRYTLFLEAYPQTPVFRYEAFVANPNAEAKRLTAELALPYVANWQDILPAIQLTGESGRSGNDIAQRPRRDIPDNIANQLKDSLAYQTLCERLGYNPDMTAPAL